MRVPIIRGTSHVTHCCSIHIAASVQVPLLEKRSIDLMQRFLSPRDQGLWRELGANWKIPMYVI